jgi:ribosomal protein S18 acetylase RimI-like enzyme
MEKDTARPISPDRLDDAVEIMSAAFRDNPLWVYIIPDEDRRERDLPRFFRVLIKSQLTSRQLYGVNDPLEGIAVWKLPNSPERKLGSIIRSELLWTMARFLLSPGSIQLIKARKILSGSGEMHKRYAPGPHYFLDILAVHPKSQGKGLASRLVRPMLERADRESLPTYTDTSTPENVTIYEHYGFEVKEHLESPETGLNFWALLRPPAKA